MEPGQRISANLRLCRLLGQGGMGSVWVADHEGLGTQVAVKLMGRAVASDPELVGRFKREAAAAAQLKSPHVAQVFDHGISADGTPYIVMELLEGEDLGKRVEREGALPLSVVGDVITQAAKALHRAHQIGIVHRDIKPENIFLTDHDGELLVKVLDFGIAKISAGDGVSVTSTQGTFGTPLYMSPEQLLSAKNVDHRADLWSLAVVAYYLLTRRFPYSGETVGAISVAVHKGVFRPPSELRPGLAASADAWFRRAFENDPSRRFGSAREMAEALRAALAMSSSTSPAVSAPGAARSEDIGHLPTMDSRPGPDSEGVSAPPGQATLGGAAIAGLSEPRRRTAALAVAGIAAGAIAAVIVLRSTSSRPADPAKDPSPAVSPPASAVVVAPQATETAPVPSASAGPTSSAATAAPGTSAEVAASASSKAAGAPAAAGGAGKTAPAKPATAAPAKKDDIGF